MPFPGGGFGLDGDGRLAEVGMALPIPTGRQFATLPNGTTHLAKSKSRKIAKKQAISGASLPHCHFANRGRTQPIWAFRFPKTSLAKRHGLNLASSFASGKQTKDSRRSAERFLRNPGNGGRGQGFL
jgi:hypothetical protein